MFCPPHCPRAVRRCTRLLRRSGIGATGADHPETPQGTEAAPLEEEMRMSSSTAFPLYDRLKREVAAGNTGITIGGSARLILAIDATASRQPTWDRACRIQGEMFEAVSALGGLAVKLMFYRTYD